MSRSSTALLLRVGLLLATALVTTTPKLHAETTAPRNLDLHTQPSGLPSPKINPTASSVPVKTGGDRQLPTQPKLDPRSPSTGMSSSDPSNSTPTTRPQPTAIPTAKPAVTSSTSQPPVQNVVNLVLKLNEKKVYVYKGDKLIAKYPVAIGKQGRETPTGEWYVMEKIRNPGWTSFKTGEYLSPGGENPLGSRWIGFWTDGKDMIGFHGTSNLKSIGTAASNGCVRMYNKHVKALYPLVKVGTIVKVVNE